MHNIGVWVVGRAINQQLCELASSTQTPVEPVARCLADIVSLVPDLEYHLQPGLAALAPVAEEQALCRHLEQLGRMMRLMEGSDWRGFYRCAGKLMRLVRRMDAWARLRGRFKPRETSAESTTPGRSVPNILRNRAAPGERQPSDGEIRQQLLDLASRLAATECSCSGGRVGTVLLQFVVAATQTAESSTFCCHCVTVNGGGVESGGGERLVAHEMRTVQSAANAEAVIKESAFRYMELGEDDQRKKLVQQRLRRLRRRSRELGKLKLEVKKKLIACETQEQKRNPSEKQEKKQLTDLLIMFCQRPDCKEKAKHTHRRRSIRDSQGAKEQQILVLSSPTEIPHTFDQDVSPLPTQVSEYALEEIVDDQQVLAPRPKLGHDCDSGIEQPEQKILTQKQEEPNPQLISVDQSLTNPEIIVIDECRVQALALSQSQQFTKQPLQPLHNQSQDEKPDCKLRNHRVLERSASIGDVSTVAVETLPDCPWDQLDSVRSVSLLYCGNTSGSIVEEDKVLMNLLLTKITALQIARLTSATQPDLASTKTQTTSCESESLACGKYDRDTLCAVSKLAFREEVNRMRPFQKPQVKNTTKEEKEEKCAVQVRRTHHQPARVREDIRNHRQASASARLDKSAKEPVGSRKETVKSRTSTRRTSEDKQKSRESEKRQKEEEPMNAPKLADKTPENSTKDVDQTKQESEFRLNAIRPKHSCKMSLEKPQQFLQSVTKRAEMLTLEKHLRSERLEAEEPSGPEKQTEARDNTCGAESSRRKGYITISPMEPNKKRAGTMEPVIIPTGTETKKSSIYAATKPVTRQHESNRSTGRHKAQAVKNMAYTVTTRQLSASFSSDCAAGAKEKRSTKELRAARIAVKDP